MTPFTTSENNVTFYAFRYALGRMTYAVAQVAEYLIEHWEQIHIGVRIRILEEITEALKTGHAGMDMDRREWQRILDLFGEKK